MVLFKKKKSPHCPHVRFMLDIGFQIWNVKSRYVIFVSGFEFKCAHLSKMWSSVNTCTCLSKSKHLLALIWTIDFFSYKLVCAHVTTFLNILRSSNREAKLGVYFFSDLDVTDLHDLLVYRYLVVRGKCNIIGQLIHSIVKTRELSKQGLNKDLYSLLGLIQSLPGCWLLVGRLL